MEWSIFNSDPTGITTFFIDEGIDTGREIVTRIELDVAGFNDILSAKQYLFRQDSAMYAKALQVLQEKNYTPIIQKLKEGRRYYVMSSLFQGVINEYLKEMFEQYK